MKMTTILSAPYLMVIAFFFLLISGEHFGGFYLLYLLMALPHGGVHALLALAGVGCLFLTHKYCSWEHHGTIRLLGAIAGVALLVGSLLSFFNFKTTGYNEGTFEQAVPIASFVLAGCLALLFLLFNIVSFIKAHSADSDLAPEGR